MRGLASAGQLNSQAARDIVTMDMEPGYFWFGAYRNFNLLVWRRGVELDAVERLERTNPERVKAHPERISTVHIVAEGSGGGPTPEARDALNTMHARYGHTVGCAAVVIERGGLMGLAVRSAVTGMLMLAPKHYRVKVFDHVDEAAPWLTEHHARSTGVEVALPDLLSVLHVARESGKKP
jgi:hypothetical protein